MMESFNTLVGEPGRTVRKQYANKAIRRHLDVQRQLTVFNNDKRLNQKSLLAFTTTGHAEKAQIDAI
jgi:hypothetical protein